MAELHGTRSAPPRAARATILTKEDLERINGHLNRRIIQKEKQKKAEEEKIKLRDDSRNLVKTWTNTLEAARDRRLKERALREEALEKERKKIDLEEAKMAAAKRKELIQKAKQQQYYQTDRVKEFHSALLFSEVLKEREAQVELKRVMALGRNENDQGYLEIAAKEKEKLDRLDREAKEARINAERQVKKENLLQAQRKYELDQQRLAEEREEQEMARKAAEDFLRDQKVAEMKAREQAIQKRSDMEKQIKQKKLYDEMNKKLEENEDEECRLFGEAKRKVMRLRAEREAMLKHQKQKNLECIMKQLNDYHQAMHSNEEQILVKAVEEREKKLDDEAKKKLEENMKMIAKQAEHREQQKFEREVKKKEDLDEELYMHQKAKEHAEQYKKAEEKKEHDRRAMYRRIKEHNLEDTQHRRLQEQADRMAEISRFNRDQQEKMKDEILFRDYADRVIKHLDDKGRDTLPLKRVAYRPMTEFGETSQAVGYGEGAENKQAQTTKNTYRRLGFVWS